MGLLSNPFTPRRTAFSSDDVNARNPFGQTRLILAAERGEVETIKALIAAGADITLKDNESLTALQTARANRYSKAVLVLAKAEAPLESEPDVAANVPREQIQDHYFIDVILEKTEFISGRYNRAKFFWMSVPILVFSVIVAVYLVPNFILKLLLVFS